jgi:hypothetical protein
MHPSMRHASLAAAAATVAAVAVAVPLGAHAAQQAIAASCSQGTITAAATIPNVLQGTEAASFTVDLTPQGGGASGSKTLAFTAGQTSLSGNVALAFGTYTAHEVVPSGWAARSDQTVTVSAAQCTATASFANAITPAQATFQVATVPPGGEAGWNFALVGPGTPTGGEKLLTTGVAPTAFATPLAEGFYTVAQTTRNGFDQSGSTGCSFTIDYPADAGRIFACKVTDTQEGDVTVTATHGAQAPSGGDAFHFVLSGGPDNVLLTQVADAANHGALDFGLLRPGGYTLCQQAPPTGWSTTLVAQGGIPNASADICLPFALAAGQAKAFTVDNTSPAAASQPTPTPAPTATPTPASGVQGVTSGSGGGTAAAQNGGDAIAIPNTGVGLSGLIGAPLLLLGGALLVAGRRRARRTRR